MNVIAWQELELAYFEASVQHLNDYALWYVDIWIYGYVWYACIHDMHVHQVCGICDIQVYHMHIFMICGYVWYTSIFDMWLCVIRVYVLYTGVCDMCVCEIYGYIWYAFRFDMLVCVICVYMKYGCMCDMRVYGMYVNVKIAWYQCMFEF